MKLSNVREGGVFTYKYQRGIVVSRCPADRSSGITDVHWELGGPEQFIWDHNDPVVQYLGQGKLKIEIILD